MSEGNFEVMPIGTMEEVREVRRLVRELIHVNNTHNSSVPYAVGAKISELERFYLYHVEKYPVTV